MNNKAIVSAITAMCLAASGLSFAQGRRDSDGRQDRRDERGAGANHGFYRGGRLPMEYRHRHCVVDDWRGAQSECAAAWLPLGADRRRLCVDCARNGHHRLDHSESLSTKPGRWPGYFCKRNHG